MRRMLINQQLIRKKRELMMALCSLRRWMIPCYCSSIRTWKFFPSLIEKHPINFAGISMTSYQVIVLVVALFFMGVLQYIIFGTRFGRAMRAVSFNFETASLMGIPTDNVIS